MPRRKIFKKLKEDKMKCCCHYHHKVFGGGYFLGFLGALIFYMQAGEGVVGILKALVWPVFIVMKILGL
ncbi:MAG TPA: hypothetical protein VMC80_01460 [Patescibacteria group bacterium]|nr:hypothetical protein [Patescibacteria group bacterium]